MTLGSRGLLADAEGPTQWVTEHLALFASGLAFNFASSFGPRGSSGGTLSSSLLTAT